MNVEAGLLILLGSARSDGDTASAIAKLTAALAVETELIDLAKLRLLPFDYGRPAQADDFDQVVDRILDHRALLIATPVYWYAMSGHMKTFFDRLSDLLSGRDPLRRGPRLAGRHLWLLAVGTDPELPDGFEVPFAATAGYLGLKWQGACYCHRGKDASSELEHSRISRFAGEIGRTLAG